MTEHDELLELAGVYALGGLSPEDRARLAEHVADGCRECEAALGSASRLADELLLAVTPVQPSPGVRAQLMDRVRSESSEIAAPPSVPGAPRRVLRRRSSLRASFAAAAGVLLTVGLAALSGVLASRLARESAARGDLEDALDYQETISWSMARDLERERSERVSLENRLTNMSRIVATIEAPLVRTLALAGQGDFQSAMAKAYLEPESGRLIVYAHNLPRVPDGRTYQLWVIVDKRPISAGLLQADAKGEAKYDTGPLANLGGPVTVAVTLEPAGGVPQPTGPLVLASG
ncbi:MAG TPA: anti-sigma factor [Myxococcota bacterium]|nr:anti-sigma factor [Myxococcota bacterium]